MTRSLAFAVWLGLCGLPGPAQTEDLIRVVRGDLLLGQLDGETVAFELAGVWVPAPPGTGTTAHYRGEDARGFVTWLLSNHEIFIEALETPGPGQIVPARVLVGEGDGKDLAVLLAGAGLALCEPSSAASADHAEAICQAEKEARRGYRGLHDGGFQRYEWSRTQLVDIGETLPVQRVYASRELAGGGGYAAGPPVNSWWLQPQVSQLHRTPIEAIRDWGMSLGLPVDNSHPGH